MNLTLTVIGIVAPIGAIDVVYYHLWKFRLYDRQESCAEQVTHLFRQAAFLGIVALLGAGVSKATDAVILGLFAIDLVSSALDVLVEHASRRSLGGLPRGEYFLHFVGTFGSAVAATVYMVERQARPLAAAPTWQVAMLLPVGVLLFAIEAGLFARSLAKRGLAFGCCSPAA